MRKIINGSDIHLNRKTGKVTSDSLTCEDRRFITVDFFDDQVDIGFATYTNGDVNHLSECIECDYDYDGDISEIEASCFASGLLTQEEIKNILTFIKKYENK